jgi:hypothetical protein
MRQIVEGKRYDTSTARKIGSGGGKAYPGDFHYYSESLYLTEKGSFFLAGEGGPLSRYGRPAYGGGTCYNIPSLSRCSSAGRAADL